MNSRRTAERRKSRTTALKQSYSRKGKTLSVPDTIVAAVAIHDRLTPITDNIRDFPMKELSLHRLVN